MGWAGCAIRDYYPDGGGDSDALFCCLIDLFADSLQNGKALLSAAPGFEESVTAFLRQAVRLLKSAEPVPAFELLLQTRYLQALSKASESEIFHLALIYETARWIYRDDLESFLSLSNLWSDQVMDYAKRRFGGLFKN